MNEESNDLNLNPNELIEPDGKTMSMDSSFKNDNIDDDDNVNITIEDQIQKVDDEIQFSEGEIIQINEGEIIQISDDEIIKTNEDEIIQINEDEIIQINEDEIEINENEEDSLQIQLESNVDQNLTLNIGDDTERSNIIFENSTENRNDIQHESYASASRADAESARDLHESDDELEIDTAHEQINLDEPSEIEPEINDNENSEESKEIQRETIHENTKVTSENEVDFKEEIPETEKNQETTEESDLMELTNEERNNTLEHIVNDNTIPHQAPENEDDLSVIPGMPDPIENGNDSRTLEEAELIHNEDRVVIDDSSRRDRPGSLSYENGKSGLVSNELPGPTDCSAMNNIDKGVGASFEDQEITNNPESNLEKSSPEPIPISRKTDHVSNFFTVHIHLDDGTVKNQIVTIINHKNKKPFLGGYRHKLSGIEYHNAAVQTRPRPRPPPAVELFSRNTQTFQIRHQKISTDNTTSTQMTGTGLFVSTATDKLIVPGKYETADEFQNRMLSNIIIIQKYYRRWLARQIVDRRRQERNQRLEWEQCERDTKMKEKEERIKQEYERRMHPKTRADFDLLYNGLEKWRQEQLAEINASDVSTAEKKAAKLLLLDEETDLLAAIDRHKIDRSQQNKNEEIQKLLGKAAAPKTWKDKKGRPIQMDTPYTIRSRELLDILNSLNMQYLTHDERLDVLLTLKHTVKEHDCKLTRDIIDLVDREADLIMRDVKDSTLAGLRKRITTLFLQYCKTPTFNPEISLLLKVPPDPSVLVGDINYCKYCGRYLRITEFSLSIKSSKLTICKSCARKENQSRNRQDYSHYRRILKDLHVEEQQIGDHSKIAFILKQNDIKTLMESVWDSKSILSECEDFDDLVFVRWDFKQHWSPWNTILLTKDEAEAHKKVTDLAETYSRVMINRINQKHVIAKNMFESLEKMTDKMKSNITKSTVKVQH